METVTRYIVGTGDYDEFEPGVRHVPKPPYCEAGAEIFVKATDYDTLKAHAAEQAREVERLNRWLYLQYYDLGFEDDDTEVYSKWIEAHPYTATQDGGG